MIGSPPHVGRHVCHHVSERVERAEGELDEEAAQQRQHPSPTNAAQLQPVTAGEKRKPVNPPHLPSLRTWTEIKEDPPTLNLGKLISIDNSKRTV